MAHPSENLENRLYLISGTNAFLPTPATGATHFRKVVCTVAGTLRVFGGVAEFVSFGRPAFPGHLGRNLGHSRHVPVGTFDGSDDDILRAIFQHEMDCNPAFCRW